ncbi:amino acid adenylation domain-containing protein [Streptomyces sp. NPDC005438]|uniref:amino acid adenylation domain-containing protein n=1 Tax=Streptomyces sp. NPDC005438 TaxID=3156880 RepID=UPI0033B5A18E
MTAATFLDLVAERLATAPETSGVTCGEAHATWAEIDSWSWAVAARLRADGIGRGDLVPVVVSRSPALVAAWLGVLRAGAAYLPVDIDLPGARVAFLARDSAARTAVVDRGGLATAQHLGPVVPLVDVDQLRGTATEPFEAVLAPTPRDTACVLYTSGSTGRPKGVLIDHDTLLHCGLRWAWHDQLTPDDHLLCSVSVTFDAATMAVASALITAPHLRLSTDAQRRDPALLGNDLADSHVVTMTPSALKAAVTSLPPGTSTRLRAVTCGGELLPRALAEEFARRLGCEVLNGWGVTECPAVTTTARLVPGESADLGIGTPLPGTRVYVLDSDLEPVPDGAPGDLYIAGTGIGVGYLGRPGLTATRFLPDPWAREPGARMYRTGDRGARRADGSLAYLGRDDHQVKIRGNRVELGEIRTTLERCRGVRAAAVVLEEPDRLVGYLEPEPGTEPVRAQVLTELRRWLPAAVLPTALWLVDRLPLNTNGKVDHQALREVDRRPLPGGDPLDGVGERELERALALFPEHLPEPAPGLAADSDYFMLGGTSMGAARLVTEASRDVGVELPLRDFLADPSVAGLARLLAPPATPVAPLAATGTGDRTGPPEDGPHPAGPAQRRLWFLNQVPQLRLAYLVPCVLSVEGEHLDPDQLADALQQVLDRHPRLRARFALDAQRGEVTYTTTSPGPRVTRLDARTAPEGVQATVRQRTAALCRTPFDLAGEPPVRAEVITTDSGALLVLCAHHIAVDAESLRVLVTELGTVYRTGGGPPEQGERPAPEGTRHRPTTTQDTRDTRDIREAATTRLRGAPVDVTLPHDRPRGPVQDTTGAMCPVPADSLRPGLLRELARSEGVTAFMVAAAVLAVTLGRGSGQRDFLFATPWGGRDSSTAGQVSMLVNTLVVRIDTEGAHSWRDLLRRARTACLAAFRDADVPFDALASELHPQRDLSRPPLTPVQISVAEGEPALPDLGPDLTCAWLPADHPHTKYELTLALHERPDGPALELDYATALFDTDTVRDLAQEIGHCLEELAKDPDGPLWPTAPAARVPLALSTGPLPGPPEETALIHQGVPVPRATLDGWAQALATRLRDRGVGAGDVVPVLVSRGPLAVAAWLGVLRAGAAYCPVTLDQPASRLAFLLRDTAAPAVVVDGAGAVAAADCGAEVPLVPVDGLASEAPRTADVGRTADSLAYVMYTSGTTGSPKGVRVTEGNLAAYLDGLHRAHPELASRRTLVASPLDTDFAVTLLHGALESGGSVVLADEQQALDGAALAELVRRHRVEAVKFTPSHLGALLRTPLRNVLGDLRVVVLGGETVPAHLAEQLAALRGPDTVVINHYGPTETTVGVLTHRLAPDETQAPPVGQPLPGVTARILDEERRPVPPGRTGTLWIDGPQVSAGYLHRPDATRAAFHTSPSGQPTYRTGDVALLDSRGRVHLRGRADDQLKVRGFRVEPGETRHALLTLPGVRQAEVLGHQGELVAFAVLDESATHRAEVHRGLRGTLPAHLVPDRVVTLERLPLATTGKIDRQALRRLLTTHPQETPPAEDAENQPDDEGQDTVQRVRGVWQDLLRVPEVPLDQAFFEAGGSSLLLIPLLERLRALTDRPLEVGDLFRHATVRSQAALILQPRPEPVPPPAPAPGGPADRGRLAARRRRRTPQRSAHRKASE